MRILVLLLVALISCVYSTHQGEYSTDEAVWLEGIYKELLEPVANVIRTNFRSIVQSLEDHRENVKIVLEMQLAKLTQILKPVVKLWNQLKSDAAKSAEQNAQDAIRSIIKVLGIAKDKSNAVVEDIIEKLAKRLTVSAATSATTGFGIRDALNDLILSPIRQKIVNLITKYVKLIQEKGNSIKESIYRKLDFLAPIVAPHIERILELKEGTKVQLDEIQKQVRRIVYKLSEGRLVLQEETKHIVIDLLEHFTKKISKLIQIDIESKESKPEMEETSGKDEISRYFLKSVIKTIFAPIMDPLTNYVNGLLDDLRSKKEAVQQIIDNHVQELTSLLEPRIRIFVAVLKDLGVQKESIKARIRYALNIMLDNLKEMSTENREMLRKVYEKMLEKLTENILKHLDDARPEEYIEYNLAELKETIIQPLKNFLSKIMMGDLRKDIENWGNDRLEDIAIAIDKLVDRMRPTIRQVVKAIRKLGIETILDKVDPMIMEILERILIAKDDAALKARKLTLAIRIKLEEALREDEYGIHGDETDLPIAYSPEGMIAPHLDNIREIFRKIARLIINGGEDSGAQLHILMNEAVEILRPIVEKIIANTNLKTREAKMNTVLRKLHSLVGEIPDLSGTMQHAILIDFAKELVVTEIFDLVQPNFSFRRDAIAPPIFPDDDELGFPDEFEGGH